MSACRAVRLGRNTRRGSEERVPRVPRQSVGETTAEGADEDAEEAERI